MILHLLNKIVVRLGLVLVILAGIIAAAILLSISMFRNVSTDLTALNQDWLPALDGRAQVLSDAGELRGAFTDLLLAEDAALLDQGLDRATTILDELAHELATDGTDAASSALVSRIADRIDALASARRQEFESAARIAASLSALEAVTAEISAVTADIEDTVYFEMAIEGEDTIAQVGGALGRLIDQDVAMLRAALETQAAVNTLVGTSLALLGTSDAAVRTILEDLATSDLESLEALLPQLRDAPALAPIAEPVVAIQAAAALAAPGASAGPRIG